MIQYHHSICLVKLYWLKETDIKILFIDYYVLGWILSLQKFMSSQFSSVTQPCPTLCDPWNSAHQASLSITTSWSPPKPMSIESVMPSSHFILCRPLLLLPSNFPSIRVFQVGQLFASGGQSIGVSASTSVLPKNTHDWSPLGWTGLISLQTIGLSRVFSNTTVQKFNPSALSLFMVQLSHPYMTTGKTIALTRWTFFTK